MAETIEKHLHAMRDELAELANKLTEARRYEEAHKILGAVMMLDTCADISEFDDYAWPAQVEIEDDGFRCLKRVAQED